MSVDYEQQLLDNEAEKKTAIENSNASYDKTIGDYQTVVDDSLQSIADNEAEQRRLQQEQTDFDIEQINQQKEQAEKDYTKEQQAAYGDYKRQTDPYGVNAEQMASMGLSQSGYSESSRVAMYTAYQNRVATARASFEQAKQSFADAIREAKLTNDINLAKIAQQSLEQRLALSMESVVYLGELERDKLDAASSINQTYYNREQDIREAQQAEIAAAQQAEIAAAQQAEIAAAQQAEIAAAQQEALLDAIQGDNGQTVADGTLEATLKAAYPDGVVDDVEFWNQMAEAAGGEEVLKEMGYSLAEQTAESSQTEQTAESSQTEQPKYTDEYTLMVEEYERLRSAYFSAQRTYDAVAKWGPAPEQKAALEAAKKAYESYPVKINPDYEPQKKKVATARAVLDMAQRSYVPNDAELKKAKKELEEELAILNNMKPYIIIRNATAGTTPKTNLGNNRNQVSMR